jgi:hypothetical protein
MKFVLLTIFYYFLVSNGLKNNRISKIKLNLFDSEPNLLTNINTNTNIAISELEFLDLFYEDNHKLKFTYYSFYKSNKFLSYEEYIKYVANIITSSTYFDKYNLLNPRKGLYYKTINEYFKNNFYS